jgi:type IV pilus assembly protein PilN
MIKINLLGDDTVKDYTGHYILFGWAASLFVSCIVGFVLYQSASRTSAELSEDKERLTAKLEKLKEVTKEVRDLEDKKKALREKLAVIATLKKSKAGPVRVMDDMNLALPERSWILDVKENNGVMKMNGMALDNQTISEYLKALEASDYFDKVELGETRQAEVQGAKIKSFSLQANVNYVGSLVPTKTDSETSSVQ